MARTSSTMLPLGTPAPHFELPDTNGKLVALPQLAGHPLLVMFICNHCPYVKHVAHELAKLGEDYIPVGLRMVAISSNDISAHPQDGPQYMAEEARQRGYKFPYLYDESQQVAKAYQAACTPDLFLFDKQHQLVYRGQLDDSRPSSNIPVTGRDMRAAIENLLAGKPLSQNQIPSLGCNIKWKAGNMPEYFSQ